MTNYRPVLAYRLFKLVQGFAELVACKIGRPFYSPSLTSRHGETRCAYCNKNHGKFDIHPVMLHALTQQHAETAGFCDAVEAERKRKQENPNN